MQSSTKGLLGFQRYDVICSIFRTQNRYQSFCLFVCFFKFFKIQNIDQCSQIWAKLSLYPTHAYRNKDTSTYTDMQIITNTAVGKEYTDISFFVFFCSFFLFPRFGPVGHGRLLNRESVCYIKSITSASNSLANLVLFFSNEYFEHTNRLEQPVVLQSICIRKNLAPQSVHI